jgi:F-type H+-transporting ATPase subunit epsilon
VPAVHPAFKCVVISPFGKLIDCQTISVVLPAHDGQVGIWHNHVPMLCKLTLGMVQITGVAPDVDTAPEVTQILIDGGFALLAANVLTITAFDAISLRDTNAEKMQKIIEKTEKSAAGEITPQQRLHYLKKIAILRQLSEQPKASQAEHVTSK